MVGQADLYPATDDGTTVAYDTQTSKPNEIAHEMAGSAQIKPTLEESTIADQKVVVSVSDPYGLRVSEESFGHGGSASSDAPYINTSELPPPSKAVCLAALPPGKAQETDTLKSETDSGAAHSDGHGHDEETDMTHNSDEPRAVDLQIQNLEFELEEPLVPKFEQHTSAYDEDCCYMTLERKYFIVPSPSGAKHFIKRTLAPRECSFNRLGRIHTPYIPITRARNEVKAIEFVRKHTDIPVPNVVLSYQDDGTYVIVMDFIEGVPMDELPEDDAQVVIGELDRYRATLATFRSRCLRSLVGEPCFPRQFEERMLYRKAPEYVLSPEDLDSQYAFGHGDFSRQNIIVDPETLKVNAVIDWEYAGFYPPGVDVPFYEKPDFSGVQIRSLQTETEAVFQRLRQLQIKNPIFHSGS